MTGAFRSIKEAELLNIAVDLFKRSDVSSATQPYLARQYARQAYRLGVHSRRLRRLITQTRVQMILLQERRHDDGDASQRVLQYLDSVSSKDTSDHRLRSSLGRISLVLVVLLVFTLLTSTSLYDMPPDQKVAISARLAAAPL